MAVVDQEAHVHAGSVGDDQFAVSQPVQKGELVAGIQHRPLVVNLQHLDGHRAAMMRALKHFACTNFNAAAVLLVSDALSVRSVHGRLVKCFLTLLILLKVVSGDQAQEQSRLQGAVCRKSDRFCSRTVMNFDGAKQRNSTAGVPANL